MKKIILFTLITVISFTLLSAKGFTLMIYICGDNNLNDAMVSDIDEMENAYGNLTSNLDIVLCVDGIGSEGGYYDNDGNHSDTRYYHLSGGGDGSNNQIDESAASGSPNTELNMSDPQTLIDFVDWAARNYKSDEYGLIIWNHGAGWGKSGSPDKGGVSDDTDGDFMSGGAGEWRAAIEGARSKIKQDFYFIGHDLCVMAYMEVLWDEYDMAEMIVGSEANEPFDGWYYDSFITSLATSNPNSHAELGSKIVTDYFNFGGSNLTMTYNVINDVENYNGISQERFLQLRDHIVWMAYYLITEEGGRDDTDVQKCIDNALPMASGTFYEDFKDLWDFCNELTNYTKDSKAAFGANTVNEANAVKTIIEEMNPEHMQSGFNGSKGLGIYLPDDNNIYYFEQPYDANSHPWGGQDAVQWTDFIYGQTTTTEPSNYSTAISNAQASVSIDNRNIVFNYNFTGAYKRIEIARNSRAVFKDFRSGTYTDRINEPGTYQYTVTAFTEDNESTELFSRTLHISKDKPIVKKSSLIVDGFVNNVHLYSIDGRNIPISGNSRIYDLSHVNKGMYFIKADSDIFKLIVIDRENMILN
ncbi:MAG: clostripain-related cysteine peptidase [bacterium]